MAKNRGFSIQSIQANTHWTRWHENGSDLPYLLYYGPPNRRLPGYKVPGGGLEPTFLLPNLGQRAGLEPALPVLLQFGKKLTGRCHPVSFSLLYFPYHV